MSLKLNLFWASQAVGFVRGQVLRGARNRSGDSFIDFLRRLNGTSVGMSHSEDLDACVSAARRDWERSLDRISHQRRVTLKDSVYRLASAAMLHRCGNCGEQTAVATIYLLWAGILPVDYMELTSVDHAFVLIGRPEEIPADDPSSWRAPMAIADPWYGNRIYPASDLPQVWGPDNEYTDDPATVTSLARWTAGDRAPSASHSRSTRAGRASTNSAYARVDGGAYRSRRPTGVS